MPEGVLQLVGEIVSSMTILLQLGQQHVAQPARTLIEVPAQDVEHLGLAH